MGRIFGVILLCLSAVVLSAQVEGTLTDAETGEPIIGATVMLAGTQQGTITDIDGSFSLPDADPQRAVLVLTYIGYQSMQVPVEGRSNLQLKLQPEASLLEEVVVIGYGTSKRSNISGAVSSISAEEIAESPITRVEQALQGRTAGVQVAQVSGSPGSPLTVRIRGAGTINNSDPLYIVDGVPVDGIDYLSPNDIASINVLKDAASAAIYGARGANGVVLITTRSGEKVQQGRITYDGYTGWQQPWKMLDLMTAREYAIISNESRINAGLAPLPELQNPDLLGEGTNWQEAIFVNAPQQSHQLTLQTGGEQSNLAVSGSYFDQEGIVGGEKSGFERYTARVAGSAGIKPWLKVGSNLNFTYLQRNFLPENNEFTTPVVRALNMDPVTPIRKADGTYAYSIYSDTDITNPVNAIENTHSSWTSHRAVGSIFAEFSILKGLNLRSAYSVDATFAEQRGFNPLFDLSNDPVLGDAPAGERNLVNSVFLGNNIWRNWQWENVLTYQPELSGDHAATFTLGTTALRNRFDFSGGSNTDLPSNDPDDAYLSNTISPIESQGAYGGADESSLLSFFGRANYDLRDRYLFTATLRVDGSSRFGANNRFGYFPSVSAAWVMSREDFWNSDAISFAKLRASWGRNGNDRIGNYGFTTVVNAGQNYTFGTDERITNGAVPLVPANPDLRWETTTQTDIGLDMEFWDGRLYLVTDYYIKETTDMLYAAPIPLIVGSFAPVRNVGSVRNTGWELALNLRERAGELRFDFGANVAFISNEVVSLGEGGDPIFTGRVQSANSFVSRTAVGQPLGAFYGYVTDGIFQTTEEVRAHAFQSEGTAPGDIRFRDLNNDGIIDDQDQTYIGNPTPDLTYGFTADMEWKGFDLSLFLQGTYGNEIYNATVRYDFTYVNRPSYVLDRWTGPGTSDSEPRVNVRDPNQNARVSDRFVEDGSYLRLKNLQLGYTLPQNLTGSALQKVRVYASVQNLFTFTGYRGLDPEIGTFFNSPLEIGIDKGFYPQARTWLAGINITL